MSPIDLPPPSHITVRTGLAHGSIQNSTLFSQVFSINPPFFQILKPESQILRDAELLILAGQHSGWLGKQQAIGKSKLGEEISCNSQD